jgi:hypothetical protein
VTASTIQINQGKGKYKEIPGSDPQDFYGLFDLDLDGNMDWYHWASWRRGDGFGGYNENFSAAIFSTNEFLGLNTISPDVTGDGVYDLVGAGHRSVVCTPNIGQPILK